MGGPRKVETKTNKENFCSGKMRRKEEKEEIASKAKKERKQREEGKSG